MLVEVVTHCFAGDRTRDWPGLWRYWRMLCYQLSSVVLDPPHEVKLRMSVYYCPDDPMTVSVLNFFKQFTPVNTTFNWVPQPRHRLMYRATGRNHACRHTKADVVWFADCDYVFSCYAFEGLQGFADFGPVVYPEWINIHRDHDIGEQYLKDILSPSLCTINEIDFTDFKNRNAIGGVQIVSGDDCRKLGYLPTSWRCQGLDQNTKRPNDIDRDAMHHGTGDVRFLKTMKRMYYSDDPERFPPKYKTRPEMKNWKGDPIELKGVYRLRHKMG